MEIKMDIKFQAILSIDAAIKAVESDGDALQYVKDQTEAVCIKAVESDCYALRYVKDQTEAVCIKAVERNGDALRYVLIKELFISIATKFSISIQI